MDEKTIATLALTLVKGVGPAFIKKVEHAFENDGVSIEFSDEAGIRRIVRSILERYGKQNLLDQVREAVEMASRIAADCRDNGVSIYAIGSDKYPSKLRCLKSPPPIVYLRGALEIFSNHVVAVIGSRKATDEALAITRKVACRYREHGFMICNGLAAGIDTAAVQIEGRASSAIGVLGSGLLNSDIDQLTSVYRSNAKSLIESSDGLLVSTCHPGTKPTSYTAIDACRYQAALCDMLVLIESAETGGSRFTTEAAVALSKPIGVVWRSTWDIKDERRSLNAKLVMQSELERVLCTKKSSGQSRIVILEDSSSYGNLDSALLANPSQNPMGL